MSAMNWIRRRYAIVVNRNILRGLPDDLLADINLERRNINRFVAEGLDHAGRPRGPYPL